MSPPDLPNEPGDRSPDPPEERSPLDPQRIVEEAREGVEHLVEEVREVVEEHLPRRVRWTAGRIAWLILGSLVVVVGLFVGGALLYVARHSVWAAGELTRVINQALAQHSNLVLEVPDLRGNPFKQVTLVR